MLNAIGPAYPVETVHAVGGCAGLMGELDAVVSQHRMDPIRHRLDQIGQHLGGDRACRLRMQLGVGKLRSAVDSDIKKELSLLAADLADIEVEVADGVALEALLLCLSALSLGQAGDAVAFQQPVQAGAGQVWDLRLQGEQHIVERQRRLLAESHDGCFLQQRQHCRARRFRPHRAVLNAGPPTPLQDRFGVDPVVFGERRDRGFRSL
jgi:hypothetical protein